MPMALQGQQLHTKLTYASTFTYHTLSRRKTHSDGQIEFRPRKIEPPRDGVPCVHHHVCVYNDGVTLFGWPRVGARPILLVWCSFHLQWSFVGHIVYY